MENHKKQHEDKKKTEALSNSFYIKLYVLLGIALIVFTIYNIAQGASFGSIYGEELAKAKEAARPAVIELITIEDTKCSDCFDINPVIDSLKRANVNITKEETLDLKSTGAKELIDKYSIEKVPVLIVTGELDKVNIRDLDKKDDALLFTQVTPPYTNTKTNEILGWVSATVLEDPSCDECTDFSQIINALKQSGIVIVSEKVIEEDLEEGKILINKYKLKVLPTLILSQDLEVYNSEIINGWDFIGSIESDGSYVTRTISPPYVNLSTNEIEGLVSMTVLIDDSCEDCYDPDDFHKPILQRMGVVFREEKRIDISDPGGKALIRKYEIEKVPTIILEGDMEKYPILVRTWADVGSIESDGTYVFRKVEVAKQTYKDLNTEQIIEPTATS